MSSVYVCSFLIESFLWRLFLNTVFIKKKEKVIAQDPGKVISLGLQDQNDLAKTSLTRIYPLSSSSSTEEQFATRASLGPREIATKAIQRN